MKKILTVLMVLIATLCTAFAFCACDLFSTGDGGDTTQNGGSTDNSGSNGGNTSGGNSSGGNTSGGNTHTCVFVFTKRVDGCITNGYDLYTCNDPTCGKTEQHNSYAPVGHDYKHETYPATCTSNSGEADVCERCGDTKNRRTYENTKTDHAYSWAETTPATCTVDGTKTGTCPDCGATKTEAIPSSGHDYGEYVSDNNATCGQDGTKTAVCSVCKNESVVPDRGTATGKHVFGEYKSNKDGNCQKDCTGTAKCTTCNKTDTKTLVGVKGEHDYVWTVKEKTCNSEIDEGVCKICGDITALYTMTTDVWCDYSGAVKTKAATCTEEGYKGATCVKCGHVNKTETYPALGHNLNSEGVCTRCGEEVGVCNEKIYVEFNYYEHEEHDFGTVYFEVVVINPEYRQKDNGLWVMKYNLYVVQTYVVDDQTVTNRKQVTLNRPDEIGSTYYVELIEITGNKEVTFSGVVDYSVGDGWIFVMVNGQTDDGAGTCYSYYGGREWEYPEQ